MRDDSRRKQLKKVARTTLRGMRRYCVAYGRDRRQQFSAWFTSKARAAQARAVLAAKYGRAIIIVD